MDQVAQGLGGTLGVDAAEGDLPVQMDRRRAAAGADGRHPVGRGPLGVADHPDHLGDDLPRLAHLDGVPDAQAQLLDDLAVVQGGAGDGGAGQQHRLKGGGGGQHAGPADVDLDVQQAGLLDLGRVLEGDGPPGELGRRAQLTPLGQAVHLDDGAVHIKAEGGPPLPDLGDFGDGGLDVPPDLVVARGDRQPQLFQVVEAGGVACQLHPPRLLHVEDKDAQPPPSGNLGVLLPQRAGRGVARVLEGGGPLQLLLLAQLAESVVGHIHLPPHLEVGGRVLPFEGLGDAADGPDVLGHILAHHAVPPGGGPDQLPVLVLQAAGQPVDLDLDHVFRLDAGLPHPAVEVPQLVIAEGVQQALHLDGVGHLGEPSAGRAAHPLGGGIGDGQLGVGGLQLPQLPRQGVVLKVLQLGGVLVVIKAVVVFDLRAQLLGALFGLFQFRHIRSLSLRSYLCMIPQNPPPGKPGRPKTGKKQKNKPGSRLTQNLPSYTKRIDVVFYSVPSQFSQRRQKESAQRAKTPTVRCAVYSDVLPGIRSRWCCRRPAAPGPETWSSPAPRRRGSPPGSPPASRRCGCTCPRRSGRRRGSP